MARSRVELIGLAYEAERLVRSGVPRAEVSRMLDLHPQTLAQWALQGKWRKKDIDLERSGGETQRTIRNIAVAHARRRLERETLEAQARAVKAAIKLIVEKGPGAGPELERLIAGVRGLPALDAAPKLKAIPAPVPQVGRSLGEYRGVRKRLKYRPG